MKNTLLGMVWSAAFLVAINNGHASIINGSFETGDFSGWDIMTSEGDYSIQSASFGRTPSDGNSQALLSTFGNNGESIGDAALGLPFGSIESLAPGNASAGTILGQTITVAAGDMISFDWLFLTNQFTPEADFNDFAFWSINDGTGATLLADTNATSFVSSPTLFNEDTGGYQTVSHTFSAGGTFILGFGVYDSGSLSVGRSGLLIDNVVLSPITNPIPEPGSLICWSLLGILGVGYRRTKRAA